MAAVVSVIRPRAPRFRECDCLLAPFRFRPNGNRRGIVSGRHGRQGTVFVLSILVGRILKNTAKHVLDVVGVAFIVTETLGERRTFKGERQIPGDFYMLEINNPNWTFRSTMQERHTSIQPVGDLVQGMRICKIIGGQRVV